MIHKQNIHYSMKKLKFCKRKKVIWTTWGWVNKWTAWVFRTQLCFDSKASDVFLLLAASFMFVVLDHHSFTHPRCVSLVRGVNVQDGMSQMSHTIQYISSSALLHSRATEATETQIMKHICIAWNWGLLFEGNAGECCLNYESQKSLLKPYGKLLSVFIPWEPSLSVSLFQHLLLAYTLINWVISLQLVINILFKWALTKHALQCNQYIHNIPSLSLLM